MGGESDPGVPEALARALRLVADRFGVETLDRVWIFPPRRRGRKEWGLVAVSRYEVEAPEPDTAALDGVRGAADSEASAAGDGPAPDRRRLHTAAYTAERTGRGVTFDPVLSEEGRAPPERLPRVMEGVVRRSGEEGAGDAREVVIGGRADAFEVLLEELDAQAEPETGGAPGEPWSLLES